MEPQSRLVVEKDRLEAAVDADPEALAEVAAITPLHEIKIIKVYAVNLKTKSLTMVRRGSRPDADNLGEDCPPCWHHLWT